MFEKLKTPAFLHSARVGLAEGAPVPLFKTLLAFLVVYLIAGVLQSVILPPVTLGLLFSSEEYSALFSSVLETQDQAPILEAMEKLLATDAVRITSLFATAMLAVTAIVYCRSFEKRPLLSMGIRKKRAVSSALLGACFALVLLFGAVLFGTRFDALALSRVDNVDLLHILLVFGGFLLQGFAEEALFRGYLMVSLARGRSLWTSMLASSFLFAYFHRTGAVAGGVAFLNFFLFGMLASLFMIRFGNLFGAAALHAGWNLGQALLFGSPVSGESFSASFFTVLPTEGGNLVSGGAFGLEGGIAVTCVLTLGVALLGMVPTKEN